jgi:tetratricopeptide (TPR) repeat protein
MAGHSVAAGECLNREKMVGTARPPHVQPSLRSEPFLRFLPSLPVIARRVLLSNRTPSRYGFDIFVSPMTQPAARSPIAPPPDPPATAAWSGRDWLFILAVFAVLLLAYQPVWRAGFIWDDDSHLTANPCIVGPLGFKGIWTSAAANYFPLVTTTLWVLHALWGLNPLPYHLVNVLFHTAGAVLLWLVLRRLRVPGAWLGALLWALHPVQVESVAWISELKNTQSGVFYLLAIWLFLRWTPTAESPEPRTNLRDYLLALVCAVLAILSKASTVMLPVVLGLVWWWDTGRWRWRRLLWLAPFIAVSAVASGWTIWEQQYHAGAIGPDWNQTLAERIVLSGRVVWFYLGKLFWPHPLIFIYPRWPLDATRLFAFVPVAVAAITFLVLWWQRRGALRPVFLAAACFGISLFPVLGFFNVFFFRYSFVGDHLQYLASMGPLVLAGTGIVTGLAWLRSRSAVLPPVLCSLLLLGLGLLTRRQSRIYQDDATLWRVTVAENPGSWIAQNNFAGHLVETGQYTEAIAHAEESLRLHPDFEQAYNNQGDALLKLGRLEEAAAHFETSLRLKPGVPTVENNLGVVLQRLGRVREASAHFREAARLRPGFADAQNNLGNALLELGQVDEAIAHLQEAVRLQPDLSEAHFNLGTLLASAGRAEEAAAHFQAVLRLSPDDAEAHLSLGRTLLKLGRTSEAVFHLQQALRLDPKLNEARGLLESIGR